MSLNQIIIHGYLGKDPALKTLPDGKSVCQFSVATSESWVDQAGEKKTKTEWHNITAWGKQAEAIAKFFGKGAEIIVIGKQEYKQDKIDPKRMWPNVRLLSFDFCGKKGSSNSGSGGPEPEYDGPEHSSDNFVPDASATPSGSPSVDDGEIPF
jgi:single-strand DNA-binding protein